MPQALHLEMWCKALLPQQGSACRAALHPNTNKNQPLRDKLPQPDSNNLSPQQVFSSDLTQLIADGPRKGLPGVTDPLHLQKDPACGLAYHAAEKRCIALYRWQVETRSPVPMKKAPTTVGLASWRRLASLSSDSL